MVNYSSGSVCPGEVYPYSDTLCPSYLALVVYSFPETICHYTLKQRVTQIIGAYRICSQLTFADRWLLRICTGQGQVLDSVGGVA